MTQNKVLFILKRREDYNSELHSYIGLSTGLYNSASFVNKMLLESGIESNMVVVTDNNDIDREVSNYRPTHVIIEALWVVPTKFDVLCRLHPEVNWIIRLHSEIPFLANEGIALDWIGDYVNYKNVYIGINAPRIYGEIKDFIKSKTEWSNKLINKKIIYLPNFYPQQYKVKKFDRKKDTIDVACFGAVRPLKNHILQALAAVKFAEKIGKKLRFHVNAGRLENKGEPVFHNLKGLFFHLDEKDHRLVTHTWVPREEFLEVCSKMDIGMQVSFSETFNIVGADLISSGVPLVASDEIPWYNIFLSAEPTNSNQIYRKLLLAYYFPWLNVVTNRILLHIYTTKTKKIWKKYFKN